MLQGVVIDNTGLFNERLQEWENFHNFSRPHGGLGGQTPMRDSGRRRGPRRERSPSVAHLVPSSDAFAARLQARQASIRDSSRHPRSGRWLGSHRVGDKNDAVVEASC
jgi:hypothetical protein